MYREFTLEERHYLMEKESSLTLEQLAAKFNCTWQEVYYAYSQTFLYGEHKKYMFEKYCDKLEKDIREANYFSINKKLDLTKQLNGLKNKKLKEIDAIIDTYINELIKTLKRAKLKLRTFAMPRKFKRKELTND